MALAIDTRYLLERWIPDQEDYLDAYAGSKGRFQLHRVCAHATVVHNCSTIKPRHFNQDVEQAALNWQADPDDDLHEVEVFHHLKQLAATSPLIPELPQQYANRTTLVASVQSPTFLARMQGLPPNCSYHRYSVKMIMEDKGNGHTYGSETTLSEVISDVARRGRLWACVNDPKIVWASTADHCDLLLVWHIQLDFVDIYSPRIHPDSSPSKRRRTLNSFQQVPSCSEEDISPESSLPEVKRFKGVRYRRERRTWVAEMKPPKSRNKFSFGDFKTQTEAARAVDAAFHYFGKPLNFADTPQILSTLPTATGLNEEAKLKHVKQQAKWLASIVSTLPSSPILPVTSAGASAESEPFEISESSTICTSGFRSFSEITSALNCGGTDEADDGVSQPDPMASFVVNEVEDMEPNFTATDHGCVVNEFEGSQSMVIIDPCDTAIGPEYSTGTRSNFLSSSGVEQPYKIQRMCMDFLILSPPAPTLQMRSPRTRHGDAADVLWSSRNMQ
ncbi:hypothetical protein M758_9G110300 [Ceratodon purpureus]|nr:hypothetical protein M758_9G110300 [Ceratodon purpureus]